MPPSLSTAKFSQSLRLLLAAVVVGGLLLLAPQQDSFTDLTRPLLLLLFGSLGIAARDSGEALEIGALTVPWTRDCSGINLLVILLALTVWVNRSQPATLRYWLRIALVFPAALLANVLRVLTLIGYRSACYPAVESPQLHYFIGFVWLVPMILLIAPREGRHSGQRALESLHAAAVLAWLSPFVTGPGGGWLGAAAILILSQCQLATDRLRLRLLLLAGWLAAGVGIGLLSIESLWLIWLLLCPLLLPLALLKNPAFWLALAAAHPLLTLLPLGEAFAAGALGWLLWQVFHRQPSPPHPPSPSLPISWRASLAAAAVALCLPFTASSLFAAAHLPLLPPPQLVVQQISPQGYELRLPGQPEAIRLVWYASPNQDRHHTVQVCLKYRGRDLTEVAEQPGVYSDGKHWIRECFIQDRQLLPSYAHYARHTLAPRSHPGAHLIFIVPQELLTAAAFHQHTETLAQLMPL
jgi:exosortase/archaeosortase family protein